ncbi:MAG: GGDEF domain-containing protein, partial [Nitrospirae bacterium]
MKSTEFLNVIFDSIRDPFSIVDRDYKIIKANVAYARMRNRPVKDLIGKRCHEILQSRDSVCEECVVEKTFRSGDPCAKEKFLTFPDGLSLWVQIYTYPIFDEEGRVSHVIEYTRDITDRKKAEEEKKRLIEKLEFLSKTDSLTGLLNRRALIESLEYEVDRSKRYGSELSLIICDMDYFKEVNDTYGHVAGDAALQVVSRAIRDSLRGTDLTGRYGGDEFMVILPETPFAGAKNFAERIRLSVKKADIAITEKHNIRMSLSLGVTCFNAASDDLDLLVKRTDSA